MTDTTPQYGRRYPHAAYPTLVYSAQQHVTPDTIRTEATERALFLWVDGVSISVERTAPDDRLGAALDTAYLLSRAAERFGALVRAELEQRRREQADEQAAAAHRAAEHQHDHPHPYAEQPAEPGAEATRPLRIAGPA